MVGTSTRFFVFIRSSRKGSPEWSPHSLAEDSEGKMIFSEFPAESHFHLATAGQQQEIMMAGQNLGRPARRRRYRSSMPLRQSGKNSIVSSQREAGRSLISIVVIACGKCGGAEALPAFGEGQQNQFSGRRSQMSGVFLRRL